MPSSTALAALLVQVLLTALGVPVPVPVGGEAVLARPAATTDGTQPAAAVGPGSRPPAWLGTRVLPVDPLTGYGVVRPTPPALRHRRWTLPDTVAPLPGNGYDALIVSPAPRRVVRRSTRRPGCPVGARDLAWVRLAFCGFVARGHTG